MNKAALHNLGEERSVGHINYELSIRGKDNLEASSRKLVLNKSFKLLEKSDNLLKFKLYRKAANEIKRMKVQWNERMKKMEEEGNLNKDSANNEVGNQMYNDLEYLKERNGPFTKPEEVLKFDNETAEIKEKNTRLYVEIRYVKKSCLSMKHTAYVFRLKRNGRNLPSNEYVQNLCDYLGDARKKTVLTANDLADVLKKLNGEAVAQENIEHENVTNETDNSTKSNVDQNQVNGFQNGEHVVGIWEDEKNLISLGF